MSWSRCLSHNSASLCQYRSSCRHIPSRTFVSRLLGAIDGGLFTSARIFVNPSPRPIFTATGCLDVHCIDQDLIEDQAVRIQIQDSQYPRSVHRHYLFISPGRRSHPRVFLSGLASPTPSASPQYSSRRFLFSSVTTVTTMQTTH